MGMEVFPQTFAYIHHTKFDSLILFTLFAVDKISGTDLESLGPLAATLRTDSAYETPSPGIPPQGMQKVGLGLVTIVLVRKAQPAFHFIYLISSTQWF